jgi:hypothetical protein
MAPDKEKIMTSKILTGVRRAALITAAAGLPVLAAAPAWADGSPVTANATVTQSITISGLSPSINFPAAAPGSATVASGAENYQVSSNAPRGYALTITPSGSAMASGGGGSIGNSNVGVAETSGNGMSIAGFSGTDPQQVASTTGPSSDSYTENWRLNVPGGTAAGNYSEQFTYLALANA